MWINPKKTADLVMFTEELPNEKLHSLCNDIDTKGNKKRCDLKWYLRRDHSLILPFF